MYLLPDLRPQVQHRLEFLIASCPCTEIGIEGGIGEHAIEDPVMLSVWFSLDWKTLNIKYKRYADVKINYQ
jgi:hypothetical protein